MDNVKNDKYYFDRMKNHFERILNIIADTSYDEYVENVDRQDITMFNLIQISENARKISTEFKEINKDIPWIDIYGLRNKIVHDYGSVVLNVVYQTLINDIPELYNKLYK